MSDEKPVTVIACTDDDLAPYVLPMDPRATHEATPEERTHLLAMFAAWDGLRQLGWSEAMYAPRNVPLLVIECGSSGIHQASRDDDGHFWVYDGDVWPAKPTLYKLAPPRDEQRAKGESR